MSSAGGDTADTLELRRQRRDRLRQEPHGRVAGLDHVAVRSVDADRAVIELHFIAAAAGPPRLAPPQLALEDAAGGPSALRIVAVEQDDDPRSPVVVVHLAGDRLDHDASRHTVAIVGLPEIDRFFSRAAFTLAPRAAPAGSTGATTAAPAGTLPRWAEPLADRRGQPVAIDYLAKDYESFRALMLSHMAAEYPQWSERNPVDLGVAIVEILAYAADSLSYYQDAVGAEAYLDTARRRISVRRHARLIDYCLHEGCNARAWVQVRLDEEVADEGPVLLPAGTQILTGGETPGRLQPGSPEHQDAIAGGARVFETMVPAVLRREHNEIDFYAWGVEDFEIKAGATSAALAGSYPHLGAGHVLELWEAKSPRTGNEIDRDARRSWPVRLSRPPRLSRDTLDDAAVTEVTWDEDDALPFDLWVSRRVEGRLVTGIARAAANVVLADQGHTVVERLTVVPDAAAYRPRLERTGLTWAVPLDASAAYGPARDALVRQPRRALPAVVLYELGEALFVARAPATPAAPADAADTAAAPAAAAMRAQPFPQAMRALAQPFVAMADRAAANLRPAPSPPPAAARGLAAEGAPPLPPRARARARDLPPPTLEEMLAALGTRAAAAEVGSRRLGVTAWLARGDLLSAGRFSRAFVVETDADGRAFLRFGDGTYGWKPTPGSRFLAVYRIGNGATGNVGALSLTQVVSSDVRIAGCKNTIAAFGGTDPEDVDKARLAAPESLYRQERCVTAADCEAIAERLPEVRKGRAIDRWTGSWRTTCLYVQRHGGRPADAAFLGRVRERVAPALLAGAELKLAGPVEVPLEISLTVKVADGFQRVLVERRLLAALGDGVAPGGERSFFYPDHFTFGQSVYLASVLTAARRVPGVAAAEAQVFKRLGEPDCGELLRGEIAVAAQEVAILRGIAAATVADRGGAAAVRSRQGALSLRLEGGQ